MKTIVKMEFGSHLYGTNVATSDKDYKGIFIPDARSILLGDVGDTINTQTRDAAQLKNCADDIDTEMFSLKQYMKLLLQGQTVALSMLFCPNAHILESSQDWEHLVANRARFLHKGVSAFAGYCRTQANKYGIKGSRVAAARAAMNFFSNWKETTKLKDVWHLIAPNMGSCEHWEFLEEPIRGSEKTVRMLSVCNKKVQENITCKEAAKIYGHMFQEYGQRALAAEKQENIDWKALMHAVRVGDEARELLTTHKITYPSPRRELLLQIRKGELPYQQVADIIEKGLERLEEAKVVSTLPVEPDHAFAEDLVYRKYGAQVLRHFGELNV